jgi:hypothetical protein
MVGVGGAAHRSELSPSRAFGCVNTQSPHSPKQPALDAATGARHPSPLEVSLARCRHPGLRDAPNGTCRAQASGSPSTQEAGLIELARLRRAE